ncbi:gp554 [Bacillus phage G]|uniref:Gp554 n=1 Tax=Bacillus phage G TaxID=2884420 RepID=G3MAT6_9CAUD|nr:gp554 [Bacillus phage G]AEO93942.1 gp554 [Bacillus phage G]
MWETLLDIIDEVRDITGL